MKITGLCAMVLALILVGCDGPVSSASATDNPPAAIVASYSSILSAADLNAGANSDSPATVIGAVYVPEFAFDTTVTVNATGTMTMNAIDQQTDAVASVSTVPDLNVGAVASAADLSLRNASTESPHATGTFNVQRTYTVLAGETQGYYLYGGTVIATAGLSAGSSVTISDVTVTVQVTKR